MKPQLFDNERIDYVNDRLSLIQKPDGLTFGTDALLLAGYMNTRDAYGIELGSGSGIISMLLLTRGKLSSALCLEVQEQYAELTGRNAELNGLEDRMTAVHCDIREYKPQCEAQTVYTNPPYMKSDTGRGNSLSAKNIARHEIMGDIGDFLASAKRMLKYGGDFYAVYRPDRLTDLITAMRQAGIEPKRATFVHSDTESESSMVLIEGKRGGKAGMRLTCPLIIYKNHGSREYSEDMSYIMENGSFPEKFNGK